MKMTHENTHVSKRIFEAIFLEEMFNYELDFRFGERHWQHVTKTKCVVCA